MHNYIDKHGILKVKVMLRGLPCRSAGLATSSEVGSTMLSCCSPACGSWIGLAISSSATSVSASTRIKYDMHETHEKMQCNATYNERHGPNSKSIYGATSQLWLRQKWFRTDVQSLILMPFSLKCFLQNNSY